MTGLGLSGSATVVRCRDLNAPHDVKPSLLRTTAAPGRPDSRRVTVGPPDQDQLERKRAALSIPGSGGACDDGSRGHWKTGTPDSQRLHDSKESEGCHLPLLSRSLVAFYVRRAVGDSPEHS